MSTLMCSHKYTARINRNFENLLMKIYRTVNIET